MVEITLNLGSVHLYNLISDFSLHGILEFFVNLFPVVEEGPKFSATHLCYNCTSSKLSPSSDTLSFFGDEALSVSNGHIYVVGDSVSKKSMFPRLTILSYGIENTPQHEVRICLSKGNCSHVGLHEMSIVPHVVLPCLHK